MSVGLPPPERRRTGRVASTDGEPDAKGVEGVRNGERLPFRAVTSQLGLLSLASLRGRLIEYQFRLG